MSVGRHLADLRVRKFDRLERVKYLQNHSLLLLVRYCVEANEGVLAKETQHAISVVDDLILRVSSFKCDRAVRNFADFIPFSYESVYDLGAAALRPCN